MVLASSLVRGDIPDTHSLAPDDFPKKRTAALDRDAPPTPNSSCTGAASFLMRRGTPANSVCSGLERHTLQ